jgi:NAD(P)-dependent dehydrogenase (short-subunit alcohol dehydrogenase family)
MGQLEGKVSLVTGAASGVGRSTAARFAREGARLVITDVNDAGLQETRELIEAGGSKVLAKTADLTSVGDGQSLVAACDERFGALHVIASVAGTITGGPIETYSEADWDRVHAVNAKGPFFLIQSALPLMKRTGPGGAIVTVSSLSGVIGIDGQSPYCSSKGAAVAMTRALAVELARFDIRVNCICPGLIDTPQPNSFLSNFPEGDRESIKQGWLTRQLMKRFSDPAEIASAILFLASDEASFITGLNMPVDGGWTAW